MTCERVGLPGGGSAIVCGPRRPKRKCVGCGGPADLLCDWKGTVKSTKVPKTCDAPICSSCTFSPAPDKDLCPTHRQAFRDWIAQERDRG